MRTEIFDYPLSPEAIAIHPLPCRDGARLLTLNPQGTEDGLVRDWPERVRPGSVVILNDTRVRRARLLGTRRPTGGRVELLLLEALDPERTGSGSERWRGLGRASKPLRPGTWLDFGGLTAKVLGRLPGGELEVELLGPEPVEVMLERWGSVPIPPYLRRAAQAEDAERYQTVFGHRLGSVAAPTAGLHVTNGMLARLAERGIEVGWVTLHVGPGTFQPVTASDLDQHVMHSEVFEVPKATAELIEHARCRQDPVVAVGTTVVRALESAADPDRPGVVRAQRHRTDLLIQPGYGFRVVDALLTNFHLPRSTLLALVSAFAGVDRTLEAYRNALGCGYRFLSYGDAMWIPQRS